MSCSYAARKATLSRVRRPQCRHAHNVRNVRVNVSLESLAHSPYRDLLAATTGAAAAYSLVKAAELLNKTGVLDQVKVFRCEFDHVMVSS